MHVRALAAGLFSRGHRVRVLAPPATQQTFDFSGCGAVHVPIDIGSSVRPLHDWQVVRSLRHVLEADVTHAHGLRAAALTALAHGDRPLVATWHNAVLETGLRGWLGQQLERIAARGAAVTLAASHDLVERARACGARDARFAPVPAPELPPATKSRAEVRAELNVGETPLVLSISRLHPQKDLLTLVRASVVLRRELPELRVLIAGDGPQRAEIQAAIATSGAPVTLLGRRSETRDLLQAADAAVLTSRWEARSLAAQEALLAGVPLVATAVGGMPGLVGEAAKLVEPGDAHAVAAALRDVLTDEQTRQQLQEAAARVVRTWPDEEQMLDQVERVYDDVLGGQR